MYVPFIFVIFGLQKLTPIRGRKRNNGVAYRLHEGFTQFTEANPDKGTKTYLIRTVPDNGLLSLQKLTLIRGRKQF